MPFGWNGSAAHFAAFGDALAIIHCAHGVSNPDWHGIHPFRSKLHVDDGIFAELLREQRMKDCAGMWGEIAFGLLGSTAINLGKLEEEGIWKHQHVILGFLVDTSTVVITLPEAKVASSQVLMGKISKWKGSQIALAKSMQQLRGRMDISAPPTQSEKF